MVALARLLLSPVQPVCRDGYDLLQKAEGIEGMHRGKRRAAPGFDGAVLSNEGVPRPGVRQRGGGAVGPRGGSPEAIFDRGDRAGAFAAVPVAFRWGGPARRHGRGSERGVGVMNFRATVGGGWG